jgi:hypothetical protein
MAKLYKCRECGAIHTEKEMGKNYFQWGCDEVWSNWICPDCNPEWPQSLEAGWEPVEDCNIK